MSSKLSAESIRALRPGLAAIENFPDNYFEYSDVPHKVIRCQSFTGDILHELPYIKRFLEDIEDRFQIPTVHTQFIVSDKLALANQTGGGHQLDLVMVNDKIEHGVPGSVALDAAKDNPAVAHEFDTLSCNLVRHLDDVLTHGGVFIPDYYRYDQFVFDTDREKGKRLVLVDTDPNYVQALQPPSGRMPGSVPVLLTLSIIDLATDVIHLEQTTNELSEAHLRIRDLVDKVNPNGYEAIELTKQAIISGLENKDASTIERIHDEFTEGILFSDVMAVNASMTLKKLRKLEEAE